MSHKKLKKDHEYKYFVSAYKMVEGRKIYIARFNDVQILLERYAYSEISGTSILI